jgi:hypothetical protein
LHVYLKQGAPLGSQGLKSPTPASALPISKAPPSLGTDDPRPDAEYREQYERGGGRADPLFQDGRYGFTAREERMDVEADHRDGALTVDRRYDGRDDRNGYERGRGDFRRGDDRRGLYSDELYPRQRGRGFR